MKQLKKMLMMMSQFLGLLKSYAMRKYLESL